MCSQICFSQVDILNKCSSQVGREWSERELDAIVYSYFEMLKAEISEVSYSKSDHRSELLAVMSRSPGAIEFKHQNISAVLEDFGKVWIAGYKPRSHSQNSLVDKIASYIQARPDFDVLITPTDFPSNGTIDPAGVFVSPPEGKYGFPNGQSSPSGCVDGYNAGERDAQNKKLGDKGEEYVVALERRRLELLGLVGLGGRVEWVANTQGDGIGYDVLSFDEHGNELWIEVKTANGSMETPFYLTHRELQVANQNHTNWCIYRVFRFATNPKVYVIHPPLEEIVYLEPISWRVWPCR